MLPTHLPVKALEQLIRDYTHLTAAQSDEYSPLEMLTGYYKGGEYGGMSFENPENDETDPMKRLRTGEPLAIQLHLGVIQQESEFIDGRPYVAYDREIAADEQNNESATAFPDETGFYGLGIWLDGEQLGIEPVRITGDLNGNILVAKATFPPSIMERSKRYLASLIQ